MVLGVTQSWLIMTFQIGDKVIWKDDDDNLQTGTVEYMDTRRVVVNDGTKLHVFTLRADKSYMLRNQNFGLLDLK